MGKTHIDTFIEGDNILTNYTNEVGEKLPFNITISSLTGSKADAYNAFKAMVIAEMNAIDKVNILVENVFYMNAKFTIVGINKITKNFEVIDLADNVNVYDTGKTPKEIYDELAAFVLAALGAPLTVLNAPFGTNTVNINGAVYEYTALIPLSGTVLLNSTKLAKYLFNS